MPVVLDVTHEPDEFRITLGLPRGFERAVIGAPRNPGDAAGLLGRAPVGDECPHGVYLFFFASSSGEDPLTLLVLAYDIDRAWTLRLSAGPVVTTTGTRAQQEEAHGIPDVVWEGTAAALYLGLWNRGDEITEIGETGERSFLDRWRTDQRVQWT